MKEEQSQIEVKISKAGQSNEVAIRFASKEERDLFLKKITGGDEQVKYGQDSYGTFITAEPFPRYREGDDNTFYIPAYISKPKSNPNDKDAPPGKSLLSAVFPNQKVRNAFIQDLSLKHSLGGLIEYYNEGNALYFGDDKMLSGETTFVAASKIKVASPAKKEPMEDENFFGDRDVKIVHDEKLVAELEEYLKLIKEFPPLMGGKLHRQLIKDGVDVQDLTTKDLYQYLLRTKEPVVFGEKHVKEDRTDWNTLESSILGYTAVITQVKAFDNGASGTSNSAIKLEQFKESKDIYIMSVSAPILKKGMLDHNELVSKEGDLDYAKYYSKMERILLPGLLEQNALAVAKGKKAVITVPGLGCGEFAGEFKGVMGEMFNAALKDILANHAKELSGIEGVVFDSFTECKAETANIGGIKYIVAPSGKSENGNIDHHFKNPNITSENDPEYLYIAQLASEEQRREFFKNAGLPLDEKTEIMSVAIEAGEKFASISGNDSAAGDRATNQGFNGAATDVAQVHSGQTGYYDNSDPSKPIFRSNDPEDQGYGHAFIKVKNKQLPLTDKTHSVKKCNYSAQPNLEHEPKISTAFYVRLKKLLEGEDKTKIVEKVKECGTHLKKQAEIIDKLMEQKVQAIKAMNLHNGVLKGLDGSPETYKKIAELYEGYDKKIIESVAKNQSEQNKRIYDQVVGTVKLDKMSYPNYYKEMVANTNYGLEELSYHMAKAFTHDIVANYSLFPKEFGSLEEFTTASLGRATAIGTVFKDKVFSNIEFVKKGLRGDDNLSMYAALSVMNYCKAATLSYSAPESAFALNKLMTDKNPGLDKLAPEQKQDIKNKIGSLSDDYFVLNVTKTDKGGCVIKMAVPDSGDKPKYVEMHFTKKADGIGYNLETYEHRSNNKNAACEYIINQMIKARHPSIKLNIPAPALVEQEKYAIALEEVQKPLLKVKVNDTDNLIKSIYENARNDNKIISQTGLEIAKDSFRRKATKVLYDLHTKKETEGLASSFSDLEPGTPIYKRVQKEVNDKVDSWLAKDKRYWSLCYAVERESLQPPKVEALSNAGERGSRFPNAQQGVSSRFVEDPMPGRGRRGHFEPQPQRNQNREDDNLKISDLIKENKLSVDDYRNELRILELAADIKEQSPKLITSSKMKGVNGFVPWLGILGVKDIIPFIDTTGNKVERKFELTFKDKKAYNSFKSNIFPFLDRTQDKINSILISEQDIEVMRAFYELEIAGHKIHKQNEGSWVYLEPALSSINKIFPINGAMEEKVVNLRGGNVTTYMSKTVNSELLSKYTALAECFLGKKPTIQFNNANEASDLLSIFVTSYVALNHNSLSPEWLKALEAINQFVSMPGQAGKLPVDYKIKESFSVLNNIEQPMKDQLETVLGVLKSKNLLPSDPDLMLRDMVYNFGKYADLNKLNKDLQIKRDKLVRTEYREELDKILVKDDSKKDINVLAQEKIAVSTDNVVVTQKEKTSHQYIYVDTQGKIAIKVPLVGGENQSSDNTCHSREKITNFCNSIQREINNYIDDLKFDIGMIKQDGGLTKQFSDELSVKQSRLDDLLKWKEKFDKYPVLRDPYGLYNVIAAKIPQSNLISIENSVIHPDGVRGFRSGIVSKDPLSGKESYSLYTSSFVAQGQGLSQTANLIESRLQPLKNPQSVQITLDKDIFEKAVTDYRNKYKIDKNISTFPVGNSAEEERANFKNFQESVIQVIKREIDDSFTTFKIADPNCHPLAGDLLSFKENGPMLEPEEECSYTEIFQALIQGSSKFLEERIEENKLAQGYYRNRKSSEFSVMAQYFVNTLTTVYYEKEGKKIDFAGYVTGEKFNDFIEIVAKSYAQGTSFAEPILKEIINPALVKKGLSEIQGVKEIEEYFCSVFEQTAKAPHLDEAIQLIGIPSKSYNDSRVHFFSSGGAICCSLEELELSLTKDNKTEKIPYRKFVYEKNHTSIGIENNIAKVSYEINIKESLDTNKSPKEIATSLLLKVSDNNKGRDTRVCHVLPKEQVEELQKRKDFKQIAQFLRQGMDQAGYRRLAKIWGMTNAVYITGEVEHKLYMLYAMKCNNEWLPLVEKGAEGKTLEALAGKNTREDRMSHMLTQLGFNVVGEGVVKTDDGSSCIVEGEDKDIIRLSKQLAGVKGVLYLDKEMAVTIYDRMTKNGIDLSMLNNKGQINDNSKIMIAMRGLLPNWNIKPDIRPYNQAYDPSVILLNFCPNQGFVVKCRDPQKLKSVYDTLNEYHRLRLNPPPIEVQSPAQPQPLPKAEPEPLVQPQMQPPKVVQEKVAPQSLKEVVPPQVQLQVPPQSQPLPKVEVQPQVQPPKVIQEKLAPQPLKEVVPPQVQLQVPPQSQPLTKAEVQPQVQPPKVIQVKVAPQPLNEVVQPSIQPQEPLKPLPKALPQSTAESKVGQLLESSPGLRESNARRANDPLLSPGQKKALLLASTAIGVALLAVGVAMALPVVIGVGIAVAAIATAVYAYNHSHSSNNAAQSP